MHEVAHDFLLVPNLALVSSYPVLDMLLSLHMVVVIAHFVAWHRLSLKKYYSLWLCRILHPANGLKASNLKPTVCSHSSSLSTKDYWNWVLPYLMNQHSYLPVLTLKEGNYSHFTGFLDVLEDLFQLCWLSLGIHNWTLIPDPFYLFTLLYSFGL